MFRLNCGTMTVIDFSTPDRQLAADVDTDTQFTGSGLEAAFEVHNMILSCMHMETLQDHPGAWSSVLLFAMSKHFGPDLVHWAEIQFRNVYGMHPNAFIDHIASYQG